MNLFERIRAWIDGVGTYRIMVDHTNGRPAFIVEVRGLLCWHTVKVFDSVDVEYARNCAYELLDMLNEEID